MSEQKDEIIEQVRQIAENGCPLSRECDYCILEGIICPGPDIIFNDSIYKQIMHVFLAGIAFEKGELYEGPNKCPDCKKEWDAVKDWPCPHGKIPF